MANRMITYGYGLTDGRIAVNESEAEIVKRVFKEYCEGRLLQEISDELTGESIEYYLGRCEWSKRIIARMIDNEKYIGADGYPQIVNDDDFIYAGELKKQKGFKKQELPQVIEFLKDKIICDTCGRKYYRRKWGTREKWICSGDCKSEIYIDDDELLLRIEICLYKLLNYNKVIKTNEETEQKDSPDIVRFTNEIKRVMNDRNPSFNVGKELILTKAALIFQNSTEDCDCAYSNVLLTETKKALDSEEIPVEYLRNFVSEITMTLQGNLIIKFINGYVINGNEQEVDINERSDGKDYNEDSGESASCENC